ncbi:hypothetical protein [Horticoccus sp. 23ND18S-11]|uniref:hypothetical protein n=1 Tax=Horticoccus sp. 23ND18S-11 TaxID=3391832 RepID=UPI0039C9475C
MSDVFQASNANAGWGGPVSGRGRPAPFFPLRPADPAIRPLPFPYRGAVAISNDAEYLDFEFFETLMRFLNTRQSTALGPGLGLRVTSSMFFFSARDYNFSYFAGDRPDAPRSRVADRIDSYLKAGWIDTIHAYGDFDGVGGCSRDHAIAAFRALEISGARPEVFSNHGGVDNAQNIGADAAYHRGDVLGDLAYHADLLTEHGVRYVWTDSLVISETPATGWKAALKRQWAPPDPGLLVPVRLQDGREFIGFRRFRGTGTYAPNLSSLLSQVRQISWNHLYEQWGAVMLYQHLGVLQRSAGACTPATIESVLRRPEVYLTPFRILQHEQDAGRLWVAGCAELLRYAEMIRGVALRRDEKSHDIALEFPLPVPDPQRFFGGLTVMADPRQGVKLTYAGRALTTTWNGPEGNDGRYSVTVTPARMPGIW